jgi:hypothetical protein
MTEVIIPIVGMLIPIVIVPTALGFKHARFLREMEHAERMKALELGRTLPQDEFWWSPPRICVAIAAGVPIGVFFCAWMASNSVGYHEQMWMTAGMVGITAVIGGTALAAKHFSQRAQISGGMANDSTIGKLPVQDDAYDVVGSRG